jgi:hypothetical protein
MFIYSGQTFIPTIITPFIPISADSYSVKLSFLSSYNNVGNTIGIISYYNDYDANLIHLPNASIETTLILLL